MTLTIGGQVAQTTARRREGSRLQAGQTRWTVLTIIIVAVGIRLLALDRQDIWWDEARNIDVAWRPLGQIAGAPELDIHPPLYFWLLHGWMNIADLDHSADPDLLAYGTRFFSVLCGTASVAALYVLAQHAGAKLGAVLAAALGALSPFWIAESQEARMYTLSFLLLTLAAIALLQLWSWGDRTRAMWRGGQAGRVLLFALFCVMALATHYNALFIVVAWFLAWVIRAWTRPDKWRSVQSIAMAGGAILVLCAPFVMTAWRQIDGYENPNLSVPSIATYVSDNAKAYFGGYAFDVGLPPWLGASWLAVTAVVTIGGLALLIWQWWRNKLGSAARDSLYLHVFWLIGGLSLYYIAVLDRGAFNVRYSSFVTPALYAVVGLAASRWWKTNVWRPLLVGVLLLGPLAPAVYADLYEASNSREDTAGLVSWLQRETGAGDVIFVDQKYPFGFYYDRYAIDADTDLIGDEVAPARYLFVDINDIDMQLTRWAGNAQRVFWVRWFESDTDPRRAVTFLLDQAGVRGGEQLFRGYEVDWWELQPPNHFELAPNPVPRTLTFGEAVETVAVSMPEMLAAGDRELPVVIRWRRDPEGSPEGVVTRPLKARVALYDEAGGRIAQVDARLLNDRHLLPAEWAIEDEPLNVYLLDVPEDAPSGAYEVRVLVYDADSLEPLVHRDSVGQEAGVEPILGQVELAP